MCVCVCVSDVCVSDVCVCVCVCVVCGVWCVCVCVCVCVCRCPIFRACASPRARAHLVPRGQLTGELRGDQEERSDVDEPRSLRAGQRHQHLFNHTVKQQNFWPATASLLAARSIPHVSLIQKLVVCVSQELSCWRTLRLGMDVYVCRSTCMCVCVVMSDCIGWAMHASLQQ
jgi:hypothetical protein